MNLPKYIKITAYTLLIFSAAPLFANESVNDHVKNQDQDQDQVLDKVKEMKGAADTKRYPSTKKGKGLIDCSDPEIELLGLDYMCPY